MSEISILCGLGNPGDRYRDTRHNFGAMVLECLGGRYNLDWSRAEFPVVESRWLFGGRDILLLMPLLFMNVSGEIFSKYISVELHTILVICDDINLPLGRLRIRDRGGSGGHRGLESIISHIGSEDFARLRLGVGSPPVSDEWSEYVLSPFDEGEKKLAGRMVEVASDAVETVIREGLEDAMQAFNGITFPPSTS